MGSKHIINSMVPACAMILFFGISVAAHEADQAGPQTHRMVGAVVTKIEASMLFVQPASGLRPRAISIRKAERMGLHDAKVGEEVMLVVDEGDVLLDIHRMRVPGAGHRLIVGNLTYADPFWGVIKISTTDGIESFAVDPLAGSKLSILKDGQQVRVELDEDNMVIDIHRSH
ncbi:MAG: hypothetical protein ACREJU_16945 [Nitrospiraceae bacterium]